MCWPCSHISENIFSLHSLETKDESSFLRAVNFFLTELATRDLSAAESCFPHGGRTSHFSPSEVEQYNYSKCTIIVRLLEFATMILVKGGQEFWKVSPNCLAFWLENQIRKLFHWVLFLLTSSFFIHSFWNKIFLALFFLSWRRWWCVSHPL